MKLWEDTEKLEKMRTEAERNIRVRTLEGYRKAANYDAAAEELTRRMWQYNIPGHGWVHKAVRAVIDAAFQEKP